MKKFQKIRRRRKNHEINQNQFLANQLLEHHGMFLNKIYLFFTTFFVYIFRCVVWTGDNRVFFFNPSTKTSLWECPPELKNRPDVEELIKVAPTKANDLDNQTANNSASLKRTNDDEETTNVDIKKIK